MSEITSFLPTHIYRALGQTVEVRSNSTAVLDHLQSVYGRFRSPQVGVGAPREEVSDQDPFPIEVIDDIDATGSLLVGDAFHHFDLRCKSVHAFDVEYYDLPGTVPDPLTLVQWMLLDSLARLASDRILVHASSVSWRGKGLVLAGPSGHGKTTLGLKLASRGFDVLSDEVASLSLTSDDVSWFPRRINLSDHSRELLGLEPWTEDKRRPLSADEYEWLLDLDEVAPGRVTRSARLRYVIILRGFAETPRLDPISRTSGLFQLMRNLLAPVEDVGRTVCALSPVLNRARCFNLVVGSPDETADLLVDLVHDGGSPLAGAPE